MKGYYVRVYLSSKGIITKRQLIDIKHIDNCYYYNKHETDLFKWYALGCKVDVLVKIGTYQVNPNHYDKNILEGRTVLMESWCLKKDYNKTKKYMIEKYIEYIPLMKKNISDAENELRIDYNILKGYKRGLSILIKKSNKIKK